MNTGETPPNQKQTSPVRWRTLLASIRPIVVVLVFVVMPIVFLRHYQTRYGYDIAVIYFGWMLIASIVSFFYAATLLSTILQSPRHRSLWTALFAGFLWLSIIATGLIYILAYLSNHAWGDTITYEIASTFAREPGAIFDFLPMSEKLKTILIIPALGVLGLFVLGAYWLSRYISSWLVLPAANWLEPGRAHQTRRWRLFMTFGTLGAAILTLNLALGFLVNRAPERLVGEPISSFLKWFQAADTLHMDNNRLQSALEDRTAYANYPTAPVFNQKNVVLIMADSLRADRMGVYGYNRNTSPFLSWLTGEGLLHKTQMALSTCSESYCGIASTLASHPFHKVSEKSLKLHGLLKDLGYRTNFFVSGDHRGWKYLLEFYGEDIDEFYDHTSDNSVPINDDQKILTGLHHVKSFSGQPNFFFFFLMSNHVSGTRHPEYRRYQPDKFTNIESLWNEIGGTQRLKKKLSARAYSSHELEIFSNRYDNGVLQTDAMIAHIFALLKKKNYLENSIVIILGDHGDGLGEHGHLGHTRYLYQEDIRIPLLIYDRDTSVYKNDQFATQIDIAPTVMDRLGLPVPSSWQGRSLLQPPAERITLHQTRRGANLCRAVVSNQEGRLLKYIRCGMARTNRTEEIYDLHADELEQNNILSTIQPNLLAQLRWEIDSRFTLTTNQCSSFECID